MKTSVLLIVFFIANFSFAQDIEDRDDSFIMENNKNLLKIDIKEPFLQIAVKGCNDFKPAAFEGGAAAYKEILQKYMYNYLNSDFYTLSGDFTFTLTIDAAGKVIDIEGAPKVLNSEVFFDDMQYVVRRIKKTWAPATCNGQPVQSEMKLKMNFTSLSADM
ncbi:energy transducer TonB [Chryseobacterium gossypii]|uniref:energy transducer TonB n=1 Tax=Chryseobacterium gossypii TaxID=3231602 RepID=UPI003524E6F3